MQSRFANAKKVVRNLFLFVFVAMKKAAVLAILLAALAVAAGAERVALEPRQRLGAPAGWVAQPVADKTTSLMTLTFAVSVNQMKIK